MKAKVWCEHCTEPEAFDDEGWDVDSIAEAHVDDHEDGEEPEVTLVYVRTEDGVLHHRRVEPEVTVEWSAWEIDEDDAAAWLKRRQS